MLLVRSCVVCHRSLDRRTWDRDLRWVCAGCTASISRGTASPVAGVDHVVVLWCYNDESRPLLTAAKSLGGGALTKRLATPLAQQVRPYVQKSTVFTWIPPSPRGRRRRGFDQGRVLATNLARALDVGVVPAYTRSGRAQFGGSRSVRLQGPQLQLRTDWKARPETDQVVVVDDVITTGASMSTAALLLRQRRPNLDIVAAALAARE